jgi:hypothetical protein
MGVSGQHHAPAALYPRTHCTGGWVGPRASLDTEARGKILCPCRGSNPDRPADEKVGSEKPYSAEPVRQRCHKKLTRNTVLAHLTVGTCHQLSIVKCHQTLFRALRLLAKMY